MATRRATFKERAIRQLATAGHELDTYDYIQDLPFRLALLTCSRCAETFTYDSATENLIGETVNSMLSLRCGE